jgi:hypothetical protein
VTKGNKTVQEESMKLLTVIVICASVFFLFWGCERKQTDVPAPGAAVEKAGRMESDWPKDAEGLVAHLNEWNKDELDVYERPDAYREQGRVASGETAGWVTAHREELSKLGVVVKWNPQKQLYEIVK